MVPTPVLSINASTEALNRCVEVVALAERKISEELVKGRAEGKLLKAGEYHQKCGTDTHRTPKASIAELGLTKHYNSDFMDMAEVPAEVIHQAVEVANVEGRPVSKAQIRRAATRGEHYELAACYLSSTLAIFRIRKRI